MEYSCKLGVLPLMYEDILEVLGEYWLTQPWGQCLGYLKSACDMYITFIPELLPRLISDQSIRMT